MSYEFKSIADVEVVAEPGKSANVLIEENGVIKKAPKTAVGGDGKWDAIIECRSIDGEEWCNLLSGDFSSLREKIMTKREDPKVLVCSEIDYYGRNYQVGAAKALYYKDTGSDFEAIHILFWGEGYSINGDMYKMYLYPDNSLELI